MSRKVYMRAPVISEIPSDKLPSDNGRKIKTRSRRKSTKCCCRRSGGNKDETDGELETSFCGCCKIAKTSSDGTTNESLSADSSGTCITPQDSNGKHDISDTSERTQRQKKSCCAFCCCAKRKKTSQQISSADPDGSDPETGRKGLCCCCRPTQQNSKQVRKNCFNCCKRTVAFFFSHVGLCSLVVGYSIAGGFIFQSLEAPFELAERSNVVARRQHYVERLWNITEKLNILYELNWTIWADAVLVDFQKEVYRATKEKGWNGQDGEQELQWSYTGALLYSVTVITTIGYGHIAPRTRYGRLVTIFYALVGIPLTLLCLANLGSLFGDCFRFFYKHLIRFLSWMCLPSKSSRMRRSKRVSTREEQSPLRTGESGGDKNEHSDKDQLQSNEKEGVVRVPLFVSILLIAMYIFGGAMLFSMWEDNWDYLIGSYFCFITLSTIGFGDFVPGASLNSWANDQKAVLCALYLVFGLSLIAMCFNLMQEEVKAKFRWLALKLNLIDMEAQKDQHGGPPTIL